MIHKYINGVFPGTESYNELFQVGCEALCNATLHSEDISSSFPTYASTCIKNALYNHCAKKNELSVNESLSLTCEDEEEDYNPYLATYDQYSVHNEVLDTLNEVQKDSKKQVSTGIDIIKNLAAGYKSSDICDMLKINKHQYKRCLELARKNIRVKLAQ